MADARIQALVDRSSAASLNDPNALHALKRIEDAGQRAEAVAAQFEKVFMGMMVKAMRATVPDGGLFGKGLGRSQYEEMLDQQWSEMAGMPRDARFHAALVRQIADAPDTATQAIGRMEQATAPAPPVLPKPGA